MKKLLFLVVMALTMASCSTSSFVQDTNRLSYTHTERNSSQVVAPEANAEKAPIAAVTEKAAIKELVTKKVEAKTVKTPIKALVKKEGKVKVVKETKTIVPQVIKEQAKKVTSKLHKKQTSKVKSPDKKAQTTKGKSQLIALLLCIFLGGLGVHRFYLGYYGIGVIQLLTAGGLGVWALIDLIRIITGDLKPKDGRYSERL